MDLNAATATAHTSPLLVWAVLIVGGLLCMVGYAFACWMWPFTKCRKCEGAGKFKSPSGKHWRRCRRCKGAGSRIRTGRQIFNWLHVTSKEAK